LPSRGDIVDSAKTWEVSFRVSCPSFRNVN
jgi:hypothetical protein